MTAPRVLCIAGSPRRRGNSDRLLDALRAGVEDAGGEAQRLVVSEVAIPPCTGCGACSLTGECVLVDSMAGVYGLLDAADAIAVVSPVYFATVPAGLKALYDRCQPYWARRYVLGEPGPQVRRPGALLLVGGGGDPFGTQCAVAPTKGVFAVLGVEMTELFDLTGVDSPTDITTHPEALERAREIGSSLVDKARGASRRERAT